MRKITKQVKALIEQCPEIIEHALDEEWAEQVVAKMTKNQRADLSAMIESDWAKSVTPNTVLFNVGHDLHMFDAGQKGLPRSNGYRLKKKGK